MEEKPHIDQRLIKASSQDAITPRKEMDLATAHAIAQKIMDIPVTSITENTTLEEITGHTQKEVGEAARTLASDIIDDPDAFYKIARKQTEQGHLSLVYALDKGDGYGETVQLNLYQTSERSPLVFWSGIPTGELPDGAHGVFVGFEDYRYDHENPIGFTLRDIMQEQNTDRNQLLFTGAKWLFSNLETWKKQPTTTILPETTYDAPSPQPQHNTPEHPLLLE